LTAHITDPLPRRGTDRTLVMPGHVGVIYQASNAVYTGLGTRRRLTLLPDGTVFSDRAAQKIRRQKRGHEGAERRLITFGARPPRAEPGQLAGQRPGRRARPEDPPSRLPPVRLPARHPPPARYGDDRAPAAYPKKHLGQLPFFEAAA